MQNSSPKSGWISDIRRHPSILLIALGSVFVMGLGQFLNRQRLKALIFFLIPVVVLAIEFGTSSWGKLEAGYRGDSVNYFAQTISADTLSSELSRKTGRTVVVSSPVADIADTAKVGASFDGGTILLRSDLSSENNGIHGWVISPYAAGALVAPPGADVSDPSNVPKATEVQLQSLVAPLFASTADALKQKLGHDPVLGPLQITADSKPHVSLPAGSVVRLRFALSVDDTDLGTFIEFFPVPLVHQAMGPDFRGADPVYPVRDYGGYISRGLWGLWTLGSLVIGDNYRGLTVEAYNSDEPWASADNSSLLLARGLIAAVILLVTVVLWILNVVDAWASRKRYVETGENQSLGAFVRQIWDRAYVWVLISPAAILILFFTLIPFVYTFLCSFTNWTYKVYLIQQLVHWQGLTEYATVFGEPAWIQVFLQVFGWTIIWAVASSATVYIMGFAHALVVESPLVKGKKFWRTILIVPWALPAMISLLAFRNIFDKDGLMNQILLQTGMMKPLSNLLYSIGLEGKPDDIIFWFDPPYNANLAKAVALTVNLWLGAPYFMMLIIGIITTIPADRYEAAMIDGANGYQRFRFITLPMVLNATIPAMIMTVTFNFNNFGAIYFLTGGGPTWLLNDLPESLRTWTNSMPGQTDILISWIYKISFSPNAQMYNKAAVYTVFIFLILGVFSVVNMRMTKSFDDEGAE